MESEIFMGSNSPTCIIFWYHMLGPTSANVGTLNVIRYDLDERTNTTMWTLRTGQGEKWNEGKVTYTDNRKHTIVFEVVRGAGLGDIALDEIVFHESVNCGIKPDKALPPTTTTATTRTTTTTTTSTTITTTPYRPPNENDCDFESSLCQWRLAHQATIDWIRVQGINGKMSIMFKSFVFNNVLLFYLKR